MQKRRNFVVTAAAMAIALAYGPASAAGKYDPGASDTEIKIGNTNPYSGPASAYGTIGKVDRRLLQDGERQGRHQRAQDQLHQLGRRLQPAEDRRAGAQAGRAGAGAVPVPVARHAAQHRDPQVHEREEGAAAVRRHGRRQVGPAEEVPLDHGLAADLPGEAKIYATYLLNNKPDAKVAILYQNDDYGKDYLNGFLEGLGAKAKTMVVAREPYEVSEPTVDPQIIKLKASGADIFFNITTPKFAAQAIRKVHDLGWQPLHFLNNVSTSVGSVLKPAGLDKSIGLITTQYTQGSD